MKLTRERLLRGAFHAAILGLIGYLVFGFTRPSPATVAVDDQTYRITGPYVHENLAVYLIHADTEDERQFITLDEGLKSGAVKVSEKRSAQVNELTIENTGDDFLFLQEGDRVKGGQQDRTIYTSLVVPPHSGQMPLPAFCVEPSRWVAGAQGMQFGGTANPALCPKEVRLAAKVGNNQGQVWAAVAAQKQVCTSNALAPNTNSSLNESLDAPKVKRIAEEFAKALNGVIEEHEDAIGVAIVINGQVEEVNFYPNHRLLGKQYPRLVQSYSLAATLKQKDAAKGRTLSAVDVGRFVWASEQEAKKAAMAGAPVPPSQQSLGQQQQRDAVMVQRVIVAERLGQENQAPQAQFSRVITRGSLNPFSNDAIVNETAAPQNVRRSEEVNKDNRVEVVEQAAVVNCKTAYHGKLVHRQYLSRNLPAAQPNRARQRAQMDNASDNVNGNNMPQQSLNPQMNVRQIQQIQVQPNANPAQGPRGNP